jgi:uncharacterized heparinase superfamily protein
MGKLGRYWHTLKYLKPIQFYGRIWFKVYRPRINLNIGSLVLRGPNNKWQSPIKRSISMLGPDRFKFLNQEYSLSGNSGWNDAGIEKLWLYNLHYFDDLNSANAGDRKVWHQALITRWLLENLPASGNGWEPYPTSLRIVNWIKWLINGNVIVPGMLESLALQASWLAKRLEWHLLGNHLFANAKALVFVGLMFEGPQAADWLATGLNIITKELPEQVLVDGGNFERSPMYHAIFLEDLLDLINAASHWQGLVPDTQVSAWFETAARMLRWLADMTHTDGAISLFNDAALGVAPKLAELQAYAACLGLHGRIRTVPEPSSIIHLAHSGYVRLEHEYALALLDVAPIGPDYLPGHAHADTLSFELSVFGQRVVVNGGTSRYGMSSDRLRERSTAAHSTVEVAGHNSSDVWGGFRVGRRAYPFDLQLKDRAGVLQVTCSHDGYKRLPGAPVHRREWVMDAGSFRVSDTVHGGTHSAVARYILHSDVQVSAVGNNSWQLTLAGGQSLCVLVLVGMGRVEAASYAPEFGVVLPTKSLAVELTQGQSRVEWIWI